MIKSSLKKIKASKNIIIKKKILKSVRLMNHISPYAYDLELKPDLESGTFSGFEIIKIKIDKEINQITLHSKDIDIKTVKISNASKLSKNNQAKEQFASKITYDLKKETATFFFKNKIKIGVEKLSIVFTGIINNSLRGFYKSKYILDGKDKFIATTQFEATDARRAFPCFDEPAQKATFKVSLIIPENHEAISNTLPTDIREHSAGYKIVSFAPTPIMSTYLLAFITGEFEHIEGYTKDEVKIRVYTTAGKINQAKFALDIAIKSIEFFNGYFDIPYPLPTLDLIAIPDFESGAMENWGAVTFRESAILIDEEYSSLSNKQWVAIVIAHELAHQWFGNLVTMSWWTDLWLNEGFASYMENLCIDNLFPHWHVWNLFLADRYSLAQRLDSLKNSHPVEVEVNHPDEINEIFDMVSYAKGSAIIRMLAEYIGEEMFKVGLRHYLKKHSYKNTKTTDLWDSFEKVSGKPVKKIMNSWTKQTGYPLVSTSFSKKGVELKQERFFSSRISNKNNEYASGGGKKSLWQIPIKYNIPSNTKELNNKILMGKKSIVLKEKIVGKINKDEISFIKVCYNKETLTYLKKEIEENRMSIIDRLGIIRDIFALSEGGYINTNDALEFSLSYKNETEYIVWSEIAGGISKIYNLIDDEYLSTKFKKYALSLFSPIAMSMGFENKINEEHSNVFLRNLAIGNSAFYGDKETIRESIKIFNNRIFKEIPADIKGVIYNIVAQNGKTKEWKILEQMYKNSPMYEEKERIGRAMGAFKDKSLLLKTLHFSLSKNVKKQDAPFIISSVWVNKYGQDLTWKFIKDNWTIILKNFAEGGHFLSRLLSPLGSHTEMSDLKDAKKFFKNNVAPGSDRTLQQVYEKIQSNSAWWKDDKKSIKIWLDKNY